MVMSSRQGNRRVRAHVCPEAKYPDFPILAFGHKTITGWLRSRYPAVTFRDLSNADAVLPPWPA
ncbi:hypothetical protein GCM10027298_04160 [Epidermidibacterium keratini]